MRAAVVLILLGLPVLGWAGEGREPASSPGETPLAQRFVHEGIAVDLSLEPAARGAPAGELREATDAVVRFKITDAATGNPVAGASPAAWMDRMDRLGTGKAPVAKGCTQKIEEFVGGSLFARPAVDLNVYYVLALNHDATITVVDPLFGFGGTKLLALVRLDSPGEDWVLSRDKRRGFVSLPDSNQIAVIDTATWTVVKELAVGPRPGRLALQPDGAYLWAALEGDGGGVAAVDTERLEVAARIPTGAGRHDLAVSDDNRFLFVTNSEAGTMSVIDVAKLAQAGEVALGAKPTRIAYSSLARLAYAVSETEGSIVAIGMEKEPAVIARIPAEPGLGMIRFAPGGRFAFVVNPAKNAVHVLDASRNRIIQSGAIDQAPDQVTFTENLAYVRRRGSEVVLMIPLDQIGTEGSPLPVVDFPGGQHPLGQVSLPSVADSVVQAPGATAVLVANPADKVIYFYKEGMAAPMGSFQNYDREPRAVLVVDRSLKERSPGVYETVARLGSPGRYEVALFLDSPRLTHCFEVEVEEDPVLAERRRREQPLRVEPLIAGRDVAAKQQTALRFKLVDPQSGKPKGGLADVTVLVFNPSGFSTGRRPAAEVGEGVYEIGFVPPSAGTYYVAVECLSGKLPLHLSPQIVLRAVADGSVPSP